jgi:hypothetical protein
VSLKSRPCNWRLIQLSNVACHVCHIFNSIGSPSLLLSWLLKKLNAVARIYSNCENKDPFGTVSLHEIQLSFTNFTTEQLSLRVGEVDGSVWLSD